MLTTRRDVLKRAGAVTLGASILSACGSESNERSASHSSDRIKVGVLFSLSGNLSIAETSMKNATMLAIDELNAKGGIGGRKIQPIVEDYASDFSVVVQKARKLVEKDKVAATRSEERPCRERVESTGVGVA